MKHSSSKAPQLQKSPIVARIPAACSDELAAVEFLEEQRWGNSPACAHCGSTAVYKMKSAKGERNARFLWRCHDCKKQYTVRVGMVFEESRLPLRHWCYAFWAACSSKKGVSALQIMRQCQISYKSALFLMHRIRWAMAPANTAQPLLEGTVEADETWVGGKPRIKGRHNLGKTKKTPVLAMVQRGGNVRVRTLATISGTTLRDHLRENIAPTSRVMTDENGAYIGIGMDYDGGHHTVNHSAKEYARGDVTTNTVEGFFSIVKRGINGIYHAVSKEHLHRYMSEFEFRYNARKLNDGERTVLAIQSAEGKRLVYKQPA